MARAAFPSGRKSLLLLALAAAIIGGAWWWQRPPPEPVYHGQRLSAWLTLKFNSSDWPNTFEEIHAFGPGVIPWLTYTAEYGGQPFERRGPRPFDNAPHWLRKWMPEKWGGLRASSPIDERRNSLRALRSLGPEAAPAIPALARILERESTFGDAYFLNSAAMALQTTGPPSWPVVERTLQNGNPYERHVLLSSINFRLGTVEKPASEADVAKVVTILVKACHDQDASVRRGAIDGILRSQNARSDLIALDPLINELIHLLSDSDTDVRQEAVEALGFCGPKAAQAIPRLIELLDDPDVYIRTDAATTLGLVDIEEKRSAARLRTMFDDNTDASSREAAADALKAFGLSSDDKSAAPEALPGQ